MGNFQATDATFDAALTRRLVQLLPDDDAQLAPAAEHLITYNPRAGATEMRRALAAYPNKLHWWVDWVNAHLRHGDAERAVNVLEEALCILNGTRIRSGAQKRTARELIGTAKLLAGLTEYGDLVVPMLRRLRGTKAHRLVRFAIRKRGSALARARLAHAEIL
jgi:hypothetical protein